MSSGGLRQRSNAYEGGALGGGRPLTLYEWVVVAVVAVVMIVASWSFGGVEVDTRTLQWTLAAIGFGILMFWPQDMGRRWGRLLAFPPFWLGLGLFGYVYVQSLNPEFRWVEGEIRGNSVWWLTNEGLSPKSDLPTSIEAPTARGNWISFLQRYAAGWFLVCAIWVGVRRREVLTWILLLLGVNALVYSTLTLVQELDGAKDVLWSRPWRGMDFSGAFYYRNHGGAFLYLNLGLVLTLYLADSRLTGLRFFDDFGFKLVTFVIAMVTAVAAVSSLSRGAWIGTGWILSVFLVGVFLRIFVRRAHRLWLDTLIGITLPVAGLGLLLYSLDTSELEHRWKDLTNLGEDRSSLGRLRGNEYTWYLFQQRPDFGWGADSYRHTIALHQDLIRELRVGYEVNRRHDPYLRTHLVAAHNDPLQLLAELGRYGVLPLAGILLFWGGNAIWRIRWWRLSTLMMGGTLIYFISHSFWELHLMSGTLVIWSAGLIALANPGILRINQAKDRQKAVDGLS